jgi:hypothetical protein
MLINRQTQKQMRQKLMERQQLDLKRMMKNGRRK